MSSRTLFQKVHVARCLISNLLYFMILIRSTVHTESKNQQNRSLYSVQEIAWLCIIFQLPLLFALNEQQSHLNTNPLPGKVSVDLSASTFGLLSTNHILSARKNTRRVEVAP